MHAVTLDPNTAPAVELSAEGGDEPLAAEMASDVAPPRNTLVDGAPPEAAPSVAPTEESVTLDANATSPAAAPVAFMDPWAPLESGDGAPAPIGRDDSVVTSAPLDSAQDSSEGSRPPEASSERLEGFRARLAIARARALAEAAAKNAAADAAKADAAASEGDASDTAASAGDTSHAAASARDTSDAASAVEADTAGAAAAVDADVAVAAVSQTMRVGPSAPPSPPPPVAAPAAPAKQAERPARRFGVHTIALLAIVVANAGLGFGLASIHREEQQGRAPVAAMSAEVKVLQSAQTAATAELEHTRERLDEHEVTIAKTIEKVNAIAQRQADSERAAKEHADREAKEVAAMNSRVNRMERKLEAEVYSIEEVVRAIDVTQRRSTPTTTGTAASAERGRVEPVPHH